ncbi:thaumatin, pathogenesis-related protein [Rhodotorula toruloides]|uniref:Thaumatin, pathogenesis-related protein n=1 Tax=Rhodotorula toruloides TaxID=5286 RepID=A0A511K828_RHOTO|nr:thaumatin, pathogenesis-related protein [Rhodotorula toruloides]
MRTLLTFAGLAVGLLGGSSLAARTIEIQNACSYTVFPAISSLGGGKQAYDGEHGWESPSGSTKNISVPNAWTGRVWGRHGCVKLGDGATVNCVTGGCVGNKLQCGDDELGGAATSAEFRLQSQANGQVDMYDLQNGGGWGVPIGIKPLESGCDAVSCTPTLSTCPDPRLMLKDSYGQILGCNSACYAGIGDSNIQCCKGDYASPQTCTPDKIQFYSYFKAGCKNAYAYFQDSSSNGDETGFVCKGNGNSGFAVIFCPEGDGDSAGGKAGKTAKASSPDGGETRSGDATRTNNPGQATVTNDLSASQPASASISTSPASAESTDSVASDSSTASGSASGAVTTAVSTSAGATAATDSSPAGSAPLDQANASSSADASTSSPTSLSKPVIFAIGGGIVLIAVIGVVLVCVISRRKNRQDAATAQGAPAPTQGRSTKKPPPGSDEEATAADINRNPAQGYNALGHPSRRRDQRALLSSASESESDSSIFSSSEDEKRSTRRQASLRSGRSARSGRSGR